MLILRLLAVIAAIAIGASLALWMLYDDKRYLLLALRVAKIALLIALAFMLLLAAQRVFALG